MIVCFSDRNTHIITVITSPGFPPVTGTYTVFTQSGDSSVLLPFFVLCGHEFYSYFCPQTRLSSHRRLILSSSSVTEWFRLSAEHHIFPSSVPLPARWRLFKLHCSIFNGLNRATTREGPLSLCAHRNMFHQIPGCICARLEWSLPCVCVFSTGGRPGGNHEAALPGRVAGLRLQAAGDPGEEEIWVCGTGEWRAQSCMFACTNSLYTIHTLQGYFSSWKLAKELKRKLKKTFLSMQFFKKRNWKRN